VGNAAPLTPSPYLKLPLGAIKPAGWLRKQLELEASGFVGHLDEVSEFLKKENSAWLSPTGQGNNGWEELPYWLRGYGDLGYVLGDERVVREARVWLEGALASSRSNGYFGPENNLTNAGGKPDLWPNMLMLNALQSYYEYSGDRRVLDVMTRYFKWEASIPDSDFLSRDDAGYWQFERGGDNLESVYWLYNRTKEPWLLDLATKIHGHTADWASGVANWHGVNFAQCFREPAEYFQQAKQAALLTASDVNFRTMRHAYGEVPGGMYGADENARPGYVDPRQATETCAFVEMMWSDELLLRISGDLTWADRCEDVAFNSLPASMTAELEALHYLTAPNTIQCDGGEKWPGFENHGPLLNFNPYDYRCCQHNVAMGWPYFAEHLWMATPDRGLAAVFYAASEVKAKVGKGETVTVKEDTRYPFEGAVRLAVSCKAPIAFPLYLRVPSWCNAPTLSLNGKAFKIAKGEGGLIAVERTWRTGDSLVLNLPMHIAFRTWKGNQDSVSVDRGPLTYSLKIVERYVRHGGTDKWPAWDVFPDTPWNCGLVLTALKPDAVKVATKPWPADDQPFKWDVAPIELKAQAARIPAWKTDYQGLPGKLQPSPVKQTEPTETVSLIPMGCARLRISSFPTLSNGQNAHEWIGPKDPLPTSASYVNGSDPVSAASDGILPASSGDQSIPRFTWWDHKGGTEWIEYDFPEPRTLSSSAVYWFDDRGTGGGCRVPASWRLLFLADGEWREVSRAGAYGVALDRFNGFAFNPVKTAKLRLEVKLQDGFSGGVLEWQVK
jgi:hypothetical protein